MNDQEQVRIRRAAGNVRGFAGTLGKQAATLAFLSDLLGTVRDGTRQLSPAEMGQVCHLVAGVGTVMALASDQLSGWAGEMEFAACVRTPAPGEARRLQGRADELDCAAKPTQAPPGGTVLRLVTSGGAS